MSDTTRGLCFGLPHFVASYQTEGVLRIYIMFSTTVLILLVQVICL